MACSRSTLFSDRSIACVFEVVCAFCWREEVEEVANLLPCGLNGPGLGLAEPVLELGEELLDGVQVGAVGRQEEEMGADGPDGAACRLSLVAAEIVEDDEVALGERRDEDPLHVEGEELAVNRPVDDPRRIDAIDPQRGDEGQRLPMAVRHAGLETLSARPPAA